MQGDDKLRRFLEWDILAYSNVSEVKASSITGSVLIRHRSGVGAESIQRLVTCSLRRYRDRGEGSSANLRECDWHLLSCEQVIETFGTDLACGLTSDLVQKRRREFGRNVVPSLPQKGVFDLFCDQFNSLPVAVLIGSAGVSMLLGGRLDALAIGAVVTVNAFLGFASEYKASISIDALANEGRSKAIVLRGGEEKHIEFAELVPGDLLILEPGHVVGADGRLVVASNLTLDESGLTGESEPVMKSPASLVGNPSLADRTNMVFRQSVVTGGNGQCIVTNVGRRTEVGKVQSSLIGLRESRTPLQVQLDQLGAKAVLVASVGCMTVFVLGLLRGYRPAALFRTAVSLAVAAVPEGLPTVATMILSNGLLKLRKHNVLARRLQAVETIGCTSAICLDKTGTITLNQISMERLLCNERMLNIVEDKVCVENESKATRCMVRKLIEMACLNSQLVDAASFGKDAPIGSSTEKAILRVADSIGTSLTELANQFPRTKIRHRTDDRPYVVTHHRSLASGEVYVTAKGSPEHLAALCSHLLLHDQPVVFDAERKKSILAENDRLASRGYRVLAVAYQVKKDESSPQSLVLLGLLALRDQVRPGMKALVKGFIEAGIETSMITGDQIGTAKAIASEVGIPVSNVHARVNPSDKLRIIKEAKGHGKIVAMMGDGVNDGPALRVANVGVAMGKAGTKLASQIADFVVADDDLRSIYFAIKQGRAIHSNLRKALRFLLSTNASEIVLMLASTGLGLKEPLKPMQLLWINLVTDVLPVIAIGFGPEEDGLMTAPPQDIHSQVLSNNELIEVVRDGTIMSASVLADYFLQQRKVVTDHAQTEAFMALTILQLMYAYSSKGATAKGYRKNGYLLGATFAGVGAQMLACYLPWLNKLLGTKQLNALQLTRSLGTAAIGYLTMEILNGASSRDLMTDVGGEVIHAANLFGDASFVWRRS